MQDEFPNVFTLNLKCFHIEPISEHLKCDFYKNVPETPRIECAALARVVTHGNCLGGGRSEASRLERNFATENSNGGS